ncbi:MAG TPA: D-arabinono-1,4-lactone oxidase [Ensifer sp.]|nr:D-arabinono-1,4-lactone oxidase [Ensifer sp.]
MTSTSASTWSNWSGNVRAAPSQIARPKDETELGEVIRNAPGPVRIVGSGHSFTPLVASDGTILDLGGFSGIRDHDPARLTAVIGAGTPLGKLTHMLHDAGQGLPNMGDIDHQTIGGALGTATHGSGLGLGAYHTQLLKVRLADGRGQIREISAETQPDLLHAVGVNLGAFGAMTEVTFQNMASYRLRRRRRALALEEVLQNFDSLLRSHRSAEFFVIPFSCYALHLSYDIAEGPADMHPPEQDEDGLKTLKTLRNTLKRLPWLRRRLIGSALARVKPEDFVDVWFGAYVSERRTRFNEMEYHLPFEAGATALREVVTLLERDFPEVYFPIEVRSVQADETWLSPFYRRATCSIAVHHDAAEDPAAFFRAVEPIFRKYDGRPHWGKMHSLTARDFATIYPRFKDAMEVRRDIDPENRFVSPYLAKILDV